MNSLFHRPGQFHLFLLYFVEKLNKFQEVFFFVDDV